MTKKRKHAATARSNFGIAILQSVLAYVQDKMKEWRMTRNATIERIILEHQAVDAPEGVYEDTLAREAQLKVWRKVLDDLAKEAAEMAGEDKEGVM